VPVLVLSMSEPLPSTARSVAESSPESGAHADAEQLARLLAGDAMAWRDLHRDHAPDVYRLARRFVHSDTEAEEVTQEVFVAAFRALDRFRGQSRLKTWLYRITVNRALKRRRWWHRRREIGDDQLAPQIVSGPGPELRTVDRDQLRRLMACIDRLETRKRTVLVLHELEGLDTREIAQVLDCPRSTVLTRLARARNDLLALATRAGLDVARFESSGAEASPDDAVRGE
jgi:RNA polymerase sigma-70 factor (ECF subfamily)